MSAAVQTLPAVRQKVQGRALVAWFVGFAPVLYLLLRGGGYDPIIRGEIGVAIWWVLLLGAAIAVLPLARVRPAAAVGLGLLVAFAIWTAIGMSWASSSEKALVELARVLIYLGVFAPSLAAQARGQARAMVNGVGSAIALVGLLAVLSRLHPAWFPDNALNALLPSAAKRLAWPVNYWNALAAIMAMGVPLLLAMATSGRTVLGRAAAAGAIPIVALAAYLTFSRGGAIAMAVGVLALLVLIPNRLSTLLTGAVAGGGAALLIAGVNQRPGVERG